MSFQRILALAETAAEGSLAWLGPIMETQPWDESRFTLLEQIGEAKANGGAVFRARDQHQQSFFAVKIVPLAKVQEALELNKKEQLLMDMFLCKHLSQVSQSPHVLKWLGSYRDDTNLYLATELGQKDLWGFMVDSSRTADYAVLVKRCVAHVLQAYKALHALGIVHLDGSLENALVLFSGTACIMDYGMSLRLERGPDGGFLPLFGARGKPDTYSPEMLTCGHEGYQGMPADIWSAGLMLLRLTLYPLINGYAWSKTSGADANFMVFYHHGVTGILDHFRVRHLVPQDLIDLLQRMMHIDPTQRPTAHACLHEFAFFSESADTHTTHTTPIPSGFAAACRRDGEVDRGCGFQV